MKMMRGSRIHRYLKRLSIFLITVALVAGLVGCDGGCGAPSLYQYVLSIFSTLGGRTSPGGEVTFTYNGGSVINIVAIPDADYQFVEWTGDVDTVADVYAAETTITMDDDYSITANFEQIPPGQFTLIISSTEGGEVTEPGEGVFPRGEGSVVNLVAEAEESYYFVQWTGNVSAIANVYTATTTITMNGDYSITANFEQIPPGQFTLTISSTEGGEVTEPGEGMFPCDEGSVVDLVAEADAGYQFLNWTGNVSAIADVEDAITTVTMNDDYTITANFALPIWDWYDLDAIRDNLGGSYILMNDLDSTTAGYTELVSKTANGRKGWQPIGTTAENDKFAGSFDGQGHEICNLFSDRPAEEYVGLFGVVGRGGVIENVGLINVTVTGYSVVGSLVGQNEGPISSSYSTGRVTGNSYVGGLAGHNSGNVSNSYSTGRVTGGWSVGGLAGQNEGPVSNSYSTGRVTGNSYVGGLAGHNSGNVSNSYSTGSVTGNSYVGGLAGHNSGNVSNSYSTGRVTGNSYVGGLIGYNIGTVSNSFWNIQTSGQANSAGGTAKTTTEMKNIATFTAWDIIAVTSGQTNPTYTWNIVDEQTYPFLSWQ